MEPPSDVDVMVSLERVEKSYAGRRIIEPTSLVVSRGERLALIGPSGSGKSTLLRMVVGLITPDAGTVRVGDIAVTPESARHVRRRIGYVIQSGGLFPHMTAHDNVTLVARLDGWTEERRASRASELAELVRLPPSHLERWPHELSGGERQRVGLMRALMLDPEVLLFDEPLGALDPLVRAHLQDDLRAICVALGKTVLLVTHDMGEAAYIADSIAVLRDGAILQRGPMRELIDEPAHPFVRDLLRASRSLSEALT